MSSNVVEGVLAINKPTSISSAQAIRDVQSHFNASKLFAPWLDRERSKRDVESHNQKQKRSKRQKHAPEVKIGHGGTLDPLATGVLILGIGSGTKQLPQFLECTKSYKAVLLFGAATDTYDSEGKVVARKPWDGVTREKVEQALGKFRGRIMQKPPIFSALRLDGKRLYEYAREGKELPREIVERSVGVESLEIEEWLEGGAHQYDWPRKEAGDEERPVVEKVLHFGGNSPPTKRKRDEGVDSKSEPQMKRAKELTPEPRPARMQTNPATDTAPNGKDQRDIGRVSAHFEPPAQQQTPPCPAPAVSLRMTVTSGFYVRSLCHDLGAAVGSLGLMANLVRTRQADFELGKNVLEYHDLAKGEEVWGPGVEGQLKEWEGKQETVEKKGHEVDYGQKVVRKERERSGEEVGVRGEVREGSRRRNTSSPEA